VRDRRVAQTGRRVHRGSDLALTYELGRQSVTAPAGTWRAEETADRDHSSETQSSQETDPGPHEMNQQRRLFDCQDDRQTGGVA
jgi:hypothetical protein